MHITRILLLTGLVMPIQALGPAIASVQAVSPQAPSTNLGEDTQEHLGIFDSEALLAMQPTDGLVSQLPPQDDDDDRNEDDDDRDDDNDRENNDDRDGDDNDNRDNGDDGNDDGNDD